MRNALKLAALAAILCLVAGCGSIYKTPVSPVRGLVFSEYSAPLSVNYDKTPVCEKWGKSTSRYIFIPLFFGPDVAWDSAAIDDAATNGRLSVVEYADYHVLNILGIYQEFTVTAYGR